METKSFVCTDYFTAYCVYLWAFQLSFTDLSFGECPPNLPTSIVAEMCRDSVAEGDHVFIDTKHAIRTDNGTGVLCQCSVTFSNKTGKVKYDVTNIRENCGSSLSLAFTDDGDFHVTDQTTCSLSVISKVTNYAEIDLRKTNQPFGVQYCAEMNLRVCKKGEFQCSDGQCIQEDLRCDAFTDCQDQSDERDCSSGSACSEGKEYCEILGQCVEPAQCVSNTSISAYNPTVKLGPVIQVRCMESTRFSTTTTTTTTTPTPTTTSTTPTTTEATTITTETTTLITTTTHKPTTEDQTPTVIVMNTQRETTDGLTTNTVSSIMSTESVAKSTSGVNSSMSTSYDLHSTSTEDSLTKRKGSVDVSQNDDVDPLKQPGVIAAIVIGTIVGVCAVGMLIWYIRKSRKKNEYQPPDLWIPTDNNKEMLPLND